MRVFLAIIGTLLAVAVVFIVASFAACFFGVVTQSVAVGCLFAIAGLIVAVWTGNVTARAIMNMQEGDSAYNHQKAAQSLRNMVGSPKNAEKSVKQKDSDVAGPSKE